MTDKFVYHDLMKEFTEEGITIKDARGLVDEKVNKFIELMKDKTRGEGNEIVLKFTNGSSLKINGDEITEIKRGKNEKNI